MAGPGGVEVGRISIRVVPDTSKFREELNAKLKKEIKGLKIEIPVTADISGVRQELKKAQDEAKGAGKIKLDVEADGDGIVRETRRIRQLAQKAIGAIKAIVDINIPASLVIIKAQMAIIRKQVQGYRISLPLDLVGWTKWLGIVTAVSGILLAIPHILGAIGGAVQVAGGLLALLPALAAGAAAGIATLVVGLKGFFSALGASGDPVAFEEALKKLTPAAQEAARALATFKEPLGEIRKAVQEELFKGMKQPLLDLKKLLPPIKTGLTGVAGGIRDMAKDWIKMATSQQSIKDTGTILGNIKKGFAAARPAAANFGQALRDITVVGSSFFTQFGTALSNVTKKFADWAAKARETGQMQQWIDRAIEKTKQFFRVLGNIINALQNITKGLRSGMGEDFLSMMERLTTNLKNFTGTKEFQDSLKALGQVMREVIDIGVEVFKELFSTLGRVFKDLTPFLLSFARGLGAIIVGGLKIIGPMLQSMAKWLSENKAVMAPLLVTLVALVTAFKLFVTVANGIIAVKKSIDSLKAAGEILGTVGSKIGELAANVGKAAVDIVKSSAKIVAAWINQAAWAVRTAVTSSAIWIQEAAKSAAFTARYYAIMAKEAIAAWLKMAAAAVTNAAKITLAWLSNLIRMVAAQTAQMAVAVARWVAAWVAMAAAALAQAARIALAWLIALGPIAIVIAAIIALVILIILNWDTLVNAIRTAWDACWKFVSDIITWIVQKFNDFMSFLGGIVDSIGNFLGNIVEFFDNLKNGIANAIKAAIKWIGDLPGKILQLFKDVGSWLYNAGKDLIMGLVNGVKAMAKKLWDAAVRVVKSAIDAVKNFLGIGSPSKLMKQYGKWTGQGLVLGMQAMVSDVASTAGKMAGAVVDAFKNTGDVGSEWAQNIAAEAPAAMAQIEKLANAANSVQAKEWTAQLTAEDVQPMKDQVLDALATGITIELDGRNVTKSVNKNNLQNRRR